MAHIIEYGNYKHPTIGGGLSADACHRANIHNKAARQRELEAARIQNKKLKGHKHK